MSIHVGKVSTCPCFILYIVFEQDQTNDIHLSRLSTYGALPLLHSTDRMLYPTYFTQLAKACVCLNRTLVGRREEKHSL